MILRTCQITLWINPANAIDIARAFAYSSSAIFMPVRMLADALSHPLNDIGTPVELGLALDFAFGRAGALVNSPSATAGATLRR